MGGKRGKKERKQKQRGIRGGTCASDDEDHLPWDLQVNPQEEQEANDNDDDDDDKDEEGNIDGSQSMDCPSKFLLYQQSVQSPKGDISYLQKFFLMYVGGRFPLHLQEDFCGTALLSTEWLRSDPRRTAVGVDLDLEALTWCMENNVDKIGADGYTRISLFHGNVLHPLEAKLVNYRPHDLIENITLDGREEQSKIVAEESSVEVNRSGSVGEELIKKNCQMPARDIVCAFNYSCCCLHRRVDLVLYFKHALDSLSRKGGIFVMDLYGGTSSEHKLKLQRRFPTFTYVWEQGEFDVLHRITRISLHFHLRNQQRKLRHAFSYNWRLWSLPEIKDCMEEAGFQSVHFWIREMPDMQEMKDSVEFNVGRDTKYEELSSFQQEDAWNAYVVGVVN